MNRFPLKSALVVVVLGSGLFTAGLVVGRMGQASTHLEVLSLPDEFSPDTLPIWSPGVILRLSPLVQDNVPERDPNDPRELIPMPGPGGTEPPGGGEPQECGIYLYQDGQLYQLEPGQLPGQGEGSPELIPLNPVPGGPGGPGAPSAPPPPPGIES